MNSNGNLSGARRPLILVTNDDSISAKGVHVLVERLLAFGDVVAVCPQYPHSGQSMALTVSSPLRINELPGYKGARMYCVDGTPVDCVKISMHHVLDRRPDLVVSGINHGSNAAVNVLYSGTMGAAMEGTVFGIPSIGFSLTDHSPDADFSPCLDAIDLLVKETLRNGLPENVCLNVNVPDIAHTPKEMREAVPCRGRWNDEYQVYTDPFGKKFYWLSGEYVNLEPENDHTDQWCLEHGIISVVPVGVERTLGNQVHIEWLNDVCSEYNNAHK